MLEKTTEAVLYTIVNRCNGKYKILDIDDFNGQKDLTRHINFLCEGGYIVMQYSSGNEYLLMPTTKGNEYFADKNQSLIFRAVLSKTCNKSAFLGSFLGGILVQLLFLLFFIVVIKNG